MVKTRPRVAVVDDDRVRYARRSQRLLRASDLDADTYRIGAGLSRVAADASAPDCLVLDLQMPGISGLDLQRELVRAGIRLPVVVITGHDEPGMQARCLAAGAGAYLRKPLEAEDAPGGDRGGDQSRSLTRFVRPALQPARETLAGEDIGPRSNCGRS